MRRTMCSHSRGRADILVAVRRRRRDGGDQVARGRAGMVRRSLRRRRGASHRSLSVRDEAQGHDGVLGRVDRAHPVHRAVPLGRGTIRARAQADVLSAHRCDRRCADDVAAGADRRSAQLGLSLHVASRLGVRALLAQHPRPLRGGRPLHALSEARVSEDRRRHAPADHVWHRRPTSSHRAHARAPGGLSGFEARASGQRRVRSAPARRLRRGARDGVPLEPA